MVESVSLASCQRTWCLNLIDSAIAILEVHYITIPNRSPEESVAPLERNIINEFLNLNCPYALIGTLRDDINHQCVIMITSIWNML